jgi:amino acid adenylation domain-containing protein
LHELFEAQVERTPEAIAVIPFTRPSASLLAKERERMITYRELNQRANQLAHYLRAQGVGPEVIVGVCMARSLEMVVGLLGILKAGGAYVPLDPVYPKERLALMLASAQAPVLLTQQRLVENLPEHKAQVVCLDKDWPAITQHSVENPASGVTPQNLAYVLFTSGSTGQPKGVAIEHHSPVALVAWASQVYTASDLVGVLASTSINFDLSVFELFVPLSWGGRVILAENALHLPTLPAARQVTLINTVPSAMAELLHAGNLPASVRTVNLAGEPLRPELVQQIYRQKSVQRVFDLYGPSEDTTYSTFALRQRQGPATIGRPIANTQAYLLDEQLQPVPIGIPGELYLGGDGLARGYLNHPTATAEKFIPNPFVKDEGGRMKDEEDSFILHPSSFRLYKTGDLARYRPDGNLEFLGRLDYQVKVRGYRIELGEIEIALNQHPAVQENVVVAQEDKVGDKRLIAYIVPKRTAPSALRNASELRRFLQTKLPDYMLPSLFMLLEALPLTPNGKVDRRALPAPDLIRPSVEETFVAPRTSTEALLADIWAEVLGLERVGIYDNFFELGGQSLLGTRVISRLRDRLQLELPLRIMFEAVTIASLAEHIETLRWAAQAALPISANEAWGDHEEGEV